MPNLPNMTQVLPPATAEQALVLDENAPNMAVFATQNGTVRVEARVQGGTVWLSQKLMAQLYGVSVSNITQHLKAIFAEGELLPDSTIKEFLTVATNGKHYKIKFYNLDAILHVGYRVRSSVGTMFRVWATARLKEYMVKGFSMDDDRLKYGDGYEQHFEELLERIRDIRSTEGKFYAKVRDSIRISSVDYALRKNELEVRNFFAQLQDRMLFAVCGHTAAEIKCFRADAGKPNMGLTHWRGETLRVADVDVAKNYLNEQELHNLNRLVTMFLDFAVQRAERHQDMTLDAWQTQAAKFLTFNEYPVLENYGRRSREQAARHVREQLKQYREQQQIAAAEAAEREDALEEQRLAALEKEGM